MDDLTLLFLLLTAVIEYLILLLAGLGAAAGGIVSAVFEVIAKLASEARLKRKKTEEKEHGAGPKPKSASALFTALLQKRWVRYGLRTVIAVSLVLCIGVAWLSTYGFPLVARWSMGLLEERAQVQVTFESVEGNLFTGRLQFRDLAITSTPENPQEISGHCEIMDARLRVLSMFRRDKIIDQFILRDGHLAIRDHGSRPEKKGPGGARKPLPRFVTHNLEIENFSVDYQAAGKEPIIGKIHLWEADRVRSIWFIFDLLRRSHLEAELNGATILVSSQVTGGSRKSIWKIENMPVTLAAQAIPPLRLMREGTIDARVTDSWSETFEKPEIIFDWELTFRGVHAEAPADAHRFSLPLYLAAARYFNAEDPRTLRVSTKMLPNQFEGAVSLDATELWETLSSILMDQIAELTGISRETQTRIRETVGGAAADFLERRRKVEPE